MIKQISQLITNVRLTGDNHVSAMYDPVNKEGNDSRVRVWRGLRPLPDVSSFKINARIWDQFLAKFGLIRKMGGTVEITKYYNRDINRYLEHQLIRMTKADERTFWRIAMSMMKRSRSFFVMALNHVYPRWYKTLPWKGIIRLYRTFKRRVAHEWMEGHFHSNQTQIRMSRVYIEKGGGKFRPLGVPSPSWRIYLHMWAALLSWRYDEKLSNSQHGFRPGRGTATAWQAIASTVLNARNIYEYDLVSFFDRVNLLSIRKVLLEFGVPEAIADYLVELNRHAIPKFQSEDLVDESRLRTRQLWRESSDELPYRGEQFSSVLGTPEDAAADVEVDFYQGVGQGTSTGPFLASLALENSVFTTPNGCVQYADDGMFFGDRLVLSFENPSFGSDEDPWRGIEFHPTKSGWVKKDGEWLKPLKFLGLVYDGQLDVLYSDTKTGKKMYFDKDNLLSELRQAEFGGLLSDQSSPPNKKKSFESMILSRFWGFVQSRLYNGSWNTDQIFQNFHFISSSKSWVRQMRYKYRRGSPRVPVNLYNASSVACRSLLEFLRTLDTNRRREAWINRPIVAVEPLRKVRLSEEMTPIRWVMKSEWKRAYGMATFVDGFEAWMTHYVSRMADHSKFTEEQMYVHYSLMYFEKKMVNVENIWRDISYDLHVYRVNRVNPDMNLLVHFNSIVRKVDLFESELSRLTDGLRAFLQHAHQHLRKGRVYK